jgi:hypothetical protein
MMYLRNSAFQSGLDSNIERQTYGLLRARTKGRYAPRQAQVFSTRGLSAHRHLWHLWRYSIPVYRSTTSVISDQIGVLTVFYSSKDYPAALRSVVIKDETGMRITFLTNNFALKPEIIADFIGNAGMSDCYTNRSGSTCESRRFWVPVSTP